MLNLKRLFILTAASSALISPLAGTIFYTGTAQNSPQDLVVSGSGNQGWINDLQNIQWRVEYDENVVGFEWLYTYTLTTDSFGTQNFFLSTRSDALLTDFDNFTVTKTSGAATSPPIVSIGTFSNPTIREFPEPKYGLFFEDMGPAANNQTDTTTISFRSIHAPGWGDIFANCGGGGNRLWNAGFTDPDPTAPANDGIFSGHMLTPIPEPGASAAIAGFCALLTFLIRRVKR